jgi:hypothetical protein
VALKEEHREDRNEEGIWAKGALSLNGYCKGELSLDKPSIDSFKG